MQTKLLVVSVITLVALVACSGKSESGSVSKGGAMVAFVKTQDGSPLEIKAELFDTAQAKEFSATGKNPYIGNADAIAQGKKLFQKASCTQCHGGDAQGRGRIRNHPLARNGDWQRQPACGTQGHRQCLSALWRAEIARRRLGQSACKGCDLHRTNLVRTA